MAGPTLFEALRNLALELLRFEWFYFSLTGVLAVYFVIHGFLTLAKSDSYAQGQMSPFKIGWGEIILGGAVAILAYMVQVTYATFGLDPNKVEVWEYTDQPTSQPYWMLLYWCVFIIQLLGWYRVLQAVFVVRSSLFEVQPGTGQRALVKWMTGCVFINIVYWIDIIAATMDFGAVSDLMP